MKIIRYRHDWMGQDHKQPRRQALFSLTWMSLLSTVSRRIQVSIPILDALSLQNVLSLILMKIEVLPTPMSPRSTSLNLRQLFDSVPESADIFSKPALYNYSIFDLLQYLPLVWSFLRLVKNYVCSVIKSVTLRYHWICELFRYQWAKGK